jgi:hypothetical protein
MPGDNSVMESVSPPEPDAAPSRLAVARALLKVEKGPEPAWPALAAAAFFAVCALGFAFGAILAPPASVSHLETR